MTNLFTPYRQAFQGLSREVWLLATAMLINRSGAMVLPFLTLYLTKELHFTLEQAGFVLSSFGLGALAGTWIGGRLTDRWNFYDVQILSLMLTGGMFFLLIKFDTMPMWCLGAFLTSLFSEILRPANMAALAAYSKPENLTRSIALQRLAFNLGFAAGPVAAGWMAHYWGYNTLFLADAFTCIGAALFLRLALPRNITPPDKEAQAQARSEGSVFRNRRFLVFVFLQFCLFLGFMQFFSTLPVFLEDRLAMNEGQIGNLMAFNGLIIVLTEMPLIAWAENRFRALQLIRWGNLFIAAALLLLTMSEDWVGFVWIYIIGITIGEMINFPFGSTYALSFTEPHNRGRYMGAYGLSVAGGFILAPWLGTQLAETIGWSGLWIGLAALVGLTVLGLMWVDREQEKVVTQ